MLQDNGTRADQGAYPRARSFVPPTIEWRGGPEFGPADPLVEGSIEGDSILVASSGGAFAYERDEPGLPWGRATRVDTIAGGLLLMDGDRAWRFDRFPGPPFAWNVHQFLQPSPGAPWIEAGSFVLPQVAGLAAADGTLLVGAFGQGCREYTSGFQLDGPVLDQAADEEALVLRGARLDEVAEVRIGEEVQEILSQSPVSLTIRPAPRAPGFANLSLLGAAGSLVRADGLESLPSLRAESSGPGGLLAVQLNNGEAGAFVLRHAFDLRPTPLVLTSPPTWFHLLLVLTPGRSGTLTTEAFTNEGRATLAFPLPNDPSLSGQPLHLQAWCRRGLFGPGRHSFTNLESVTF